MAATYGSIKSAAVVLLSYGTECARFDSRNVIIARARGIADLEMEFMNPTVEQCSFFRYCLTGRYKVTIEVDNVVSFEGHCTSFAYGAGPLDNGGTSAQVTFSIVDRTTRALPEQDHVLPQGVSGDIVTMAGIPDLVGQTWTIAENESSSPRCRNCGGNTVNTTRLGMETEFTCRECSAVLGVNSDGTVRQKKTRKRKPKKKAEPDVTTAPPERMIVLE